MEITCNAFYCTLINLRATKSIKAQNLKSVRFWRESGMCKYLSHSNVNEFMLHFARFLLLESRELDRKGGKFSALG